MPAETSPPCVVAGPGPDNMRHDQHKNRRMATWLTIVAISVVVAVVSGVGVLAIMARVSRGISPPEMADGRLAPCPDRPNCVCSEAVTAGGNAVAPIPYTGSADDALETFKRAIVAEGGVVAREAPGYLAATFTTRVFGFVDDLEVRVGESDSVLHVRSASRVGYSDLGSNRRRVEALARRFKDSAP